MDPSGLVRWAGCKGGVGVGSSLLRLLGRRLSVPWGLGGLSARQQRLPALPRAARTTAGPRFPAGLHGRAVLVTCSPPEPGTARGDGPGRVLHQLENSREGPALPPPPRRAEGISEIRQDHIASHCWEMFILEMELLLPSPPRRSRGLPVTPHLGARSTPRAHPPGTSCFPSRGARCEGGRRSLWVRVQTWGDEHRRPPPRHLRGEAAPTAREEPPQRGRGSYLWRRSGGASRAGTSRSEAKGVEPNRAELSRDGPSRAERSRGRCSRGGSRPPAGTWGGPGGGARRAGRGPAGSAGTGIASGAPGAPAGTENVPGTTRTCRSYRTFRTGWDSHQEHCQLWSLAMAAVASGATFLLVRR